MVTDARELISIFDLCSLLPPALDFRLIHHNHVLIVNILALTSVRACISLAGRLRFLVCMSPVVAEAELVSQLLAGIARVRRAGHVARLHSLILVWFHRLSAALRHCDLDFRFVPHIVLLSLANLNLRLVARKRVTGLLILRMGVGVQIIHNLI